MVEQLNTQHTVELIASLRERIKKLDCDHNRDRKIAAFITMNRQETFNYEDRAQRLSELRRELLDLMRSQK